MQNKWLGRSDNCRWAHVLTPFLVCTSPGMKAFESYANTYEDMLSRCVLSRRTSLLISLEEAERTR